MIYHIRISNLHLMQRDHPQKPICIRKCVTRWTRPRHRMTLSPKVFPSFTFFFSENFIFEKFGCALVLCHVPEDITLPFSSYFFRSCSKLNFVKSKKMYYEIFWRFRKINDTNVIVFLSDFCFEDLTIDRFLWRQWNYIRNKFNVLTIWYEKEQG